MKTRRWLILLCILSFPAFHSQCLGQQSKPAPDTTGLANIESRLDDFKTIIQSMTDNISKCGSMDSIKQFASIMASISDTLMNHIAPIFDGFYALHPDQVEPLRSISNLSAHIIQTKNPVKAKKINQKLVVEYNNLVKAK